MDRGVQTEEDLAAIKLEVDQAVERAWAFAKSSPLPDPTELLAYVYVDTSED